MPSNFEDVKAFHTKFGGEMPDRPQEIPLDYFALLMAHIREESEEIAKAAAMGDIPGTLDGLVDLVYVVMGGAVRAGLPWQDAWDLVHAANMAKQRARADGSDSKRGSSLDVVKPEGWVSPDRAIAALVWRRMQDDGGDAR